MNIKEDIKEDEDLIGIYLNRNLTQLMENNKISLTMLHKNTGIAIPSIKRLQSDPKTNPTISTLLPIANFFGIAINQLIGKDPIPTTIIGYHEDPTYWDKVPLIEWGQIIDWPKMSNTNQIDSFILVDIDVGKKPYALIVEGDDWAQITAGSILIINNETKPENRDFVIVYKDNHRPTLKQILIDGEKIYLKSPNPLIPLAVYDESYRFCGVLFQIRKNVRV